ncbi:Hypoxia up-regulated protein 1, partial [Desmophyllum pertusum]
IVYNLCSLLYNETKQALFLLAARCIEQAQILTMLIRKPGMMLFITAVVLLSCFVFPSDGLAVMSVDLGSQFMKVAIVKPGVPMEIVLNTESRRKTPVAVSLKDNERLFSDGALTMSVKYPKKSYIYVQNVLGEKFSKPAGTAVQAKVII